MAQGAGRRGELVARFPFQFRQPAVHEAGNLRELMALRRLAVCEQPWKTNDCNSNAAPAGVG